MVVILIFKEGSKKNGYGMLWGRWLFIANDVSQLYPHLKLLFKKLSTLTVNGAHRLLSYNRAVLYI